jgi:hypothetical protein
MALIRSPDLRPAASAADEIGEHREGEDRRDEIRSRAVGDDRSAHRQPLRGETRTIPGNSFADKANIAAEWDG